jgi:acetyl-CoA carboxylase biotin carboxyl carrier protein
MTIDGDVLIQLRQQVRQLVAEVAGPLRRVRMRSGDTVLEIEWHGTPSTAQTPADEPSLPPATTDVAVPAGAGPVPLAATTQAADHTERSTIVSPIVGVFYRAAESDAAPFVEVGDVVEPGQVIGIVEAMKLMNRITAEQAGKVAEVLVGNGEPVEFEQPLIALVRA